ncbi:MAG: tail fiber domain-containing protein, partial [Xanthomonadaceae bacterium]|nr:tail fiber domain-containing protein [Xanthomonadaceae bacterium]
MSTGDNQFLVRADGGFGFNTNTVQTGIEAVFQGRTGPNPNVDIYLRPAAHPRGINLAMIPTSGAAAFRIAQFNGSNFTDRLFLQSNGDFLVTANAFKPGGGSWASSSDARLKKNIEPLRGALPRLLQLAGVTFEY